MYPDRAIDGLPYFFKMLKGRSMSMILNGHMPTSSLPLEFWVTPSTLCLFGTSTTQSINFRR
jgi:hypothetical protein